MKNAKNIDGGLYGGLQKKNWGEEEKGIFFSIIRH